MSYAASSSSRSSRLAARQPLRRPTPSPSTAGSPAVLATRGAKGPSSRSGTAATSPSSPASACSSSRSGVRAARASFEALRGGCGAGPHVFGGYPSRRLARVAQNVVKVALSRGSGSRQWQLVRDSRGAVVLVTFRCPICTLLNTLDGSTIMADGAVLQEVTCVTDSCQVSYHVQLVGWDLAGVSQVPDLSYVCRSHERDN